MTPDTEDISIRISAEAETVLVVLHRLDGGKAVDLEDLQDELVPGEMRFHIFSDALVELLACGRAYQPSGGFIKATDYGTTTEHIRW
ncbi:hypothetical protein [Halobellus ruber]|uniref:Uncharacterized protein n=1 Tax=Halobellus ruber TaxID=2761102 RepID=A0A7J9SEV6_9EURY|nr:hypothetical protein [Halobellus ruber]MBB6645052.1 hypothetical protein [Halobellus ruber]